MDNPPARLEVRGIGVIYATRRLCAFKSTRFEKGEKTFANPRMANAAGSAR